MPIRHDKAHGAFIRTRERLTPHDRAELDKFHKFLRDTAAMTPAELEAKHGDYMDGKDVEPQGKE